MPNDVAHVWPWRNLKKLKTYAGSCESSIVLRSMVPVLPRPHLTGWHTVHERLSRNVKAVEVRDDSIRGFKFWRRWLILTPHCSYALCRSTAKHRCQTCPVPFASVPCRQKVVLCCLPFRCRYNVDAVKALVWCAWPMGRGPTFLGQHSSARKGYPCYPCYRKVQGNIMGPNSWGRGASRALQKTWQWLRLIRAYLGQYTLFLRIFMYLWTSFAIEARASSRHSPSFTNHLQQISAMKRYEKIWKEDKRSGNLRVLITSQELQLSGMPGQAVSEVHADSDLIWATGCD